MMPFAAPDGLAGAVPGCCKLRHPNKEFIRFLDADEAVVALAQAIHAILHTQKQSKVRA